MERIVLYLILTLVCIHGVLSQPSVPLDFRSHAGSNAVELIWSPNQPVESVSTYHVYRSTDRVAYTLIDSTESATYTDTDVNSGQTYYYYVRARNAVGVGPESFRDASTPYQDHGRFMEFDGVDDSVHLANSDELQFAGTSFSVDFWVRPRSFPSGAALDNLFGRFTSAAGDGYMLRVNGSGQLDFRIANFLIGFTTVESLQLNEWQHVAVTFFRHPSDPFSNEALIYVDGVQLTPQAAALVVEAPPTPGGSFVIGGDPTGNQRFFDGYIDEMRAWNFVLPSTEVNQIRCERKMGNEVGLVGLWHFDEDAFGLSPSVFDHSANNNDGGGLGRLVADFQPRALDDRDSTVEHTSVAIPILINDTSTGGNDQTVSVLSNPANGTAVVSANDSLITYTPTAGFTGVDSFQYLLCEGTGICSAEGVYIPRCDTATVLIYVQCQDRRELDWDAWAVAQEPQDSVIVDDGFLLSFASEDPDGIVNASAVASGAAGNVLEWQQDESAPSQSSSLLVTFGRTLTQVSFDISDLDLSATSQDRITVDGYSSGTVVNLESPHFVAGADVSYLGANTFEGTTTLGGDADRHRVLFGFPEALDSIRFTFSQGNALPDPSIHSIHMGDWSWCKVPNAPPYLSDGMGGSADTLSLSATSGLIETFCIVDLMDPNQDSIELTSWTAIAATGSLDLGIATDTCFQYTSPAAFEGSDLFSLEFCDLRDPPLCSSIVLSLDVAAPLVNSAPSIVDNNELSVDTLWYETQKAQALDLCLTVRDNEGDAVSISELTLLDGGGQATVIAGSDTCLTFTPSAEFIGQALAAVNVCDNGAPSMCDSVVVVIDVLATPPTANDDAYQVQVNTTDTLLVIENDLNPDSSDLTISITSAPTNGSFAVLSDWRIRYVPNTGFVGADSLIYEICDEGGLLSAPRCSSATVLLTVFEPELENTPPQIIDNDGNAIDSIIVETVDLIPIEVCLNVAEMDGDSLSLQITNSGTISGGVVIGEELCFLYQPDPGFDGIDVLDVIVCDNQTPALCDSVSVLIEVRDYMSPQAVDDFLYVDEGQSGAVSVQDNDISPLGFTLTTSLTAGNPIHGTASWSDPWLNYQPPLGFFGVDTVNYAVCDSLDLAGSCSSADVVVYVGCTERTTLAWEDYGISTQPEGESLRAENISLSVSTNGGRLSAEFSDDLGNHLQWSREDNLSEVSELRWVFNNPVDQLCFTIGDMGSDGPVADRVTIDGYTNGERYTIRTYDVLMGSDISHGAGNQFTASAPASTGDLAGMVDVCFFVALDSVVLTLDNGLNGGTSLTQVVGIGALSWCRSDAEPPPIGSELVVSEGISPNGDGILDYWVIEGIENHALNQVQVFNLWGDLVYEAANYDNLSVKWDGRSNRRGAVGGATLPEGAYLYVIRFPNGETRKGHVVLKK